MKKRNPFVIGLVIGSILIFGLLFNLVNNRLHLAKEREVMNEFSAILGQKDLTVTEVIKYLDEQINTVSKENAARLVLGLERVQQVNLDKWQKRYEDSGLQEKIARVYASNWRLENIANLPDEDLKQILLETVANGFKVETAEGTFFPVIDYTFFRKYHPFITADLVAYLEIMAVESEHAPAKDAALVIGWEEILHRAENQEQFLRKYPSSTQVEPVARLLQRYVSFTLFGCNNTPLFSYDSKRMKTEARQAYEEYLRSGRDGDFSTLLQEYLSILEENDFHLTKEVEEYRKNALAAWEIKK